MAFSPLVCVCLYGAEECVRFYFVVSSCSVFFGGRDVKKIRPKPPVQSAQPTRSATSTKGLVSLAPTPAESRAEKTPTAPTTSFATPTIAVDRVFKGACVDASLLPLMAEQKSLPNKPPTQNKTPMERILGKIARFEKTANPA